MIKVLYICNEDRSLGGSSLSLADMLEALRGEVEPFLLLREEGPVADYFRAKGFTCTVIPFRRASFHAKGLVRLLRFLPHALTTAIIQRRCIRRCRKQFAGIDLVHSNSGAVDIGLRIARSLGVPHIWHIREYLDTGLGMHPFPCWKHWKKEVAASDGVIAISRGLFRHLGLDSHPDAIILSDTVAYPSPLPPIRTEKEPIVLFLGGVISPAKGPLEALEIFSLASLGNCRLKMVGRINQALHNDLEQYAREKGIGDKVDFLPFTEDVHPLLAQAAALLVCSRAEGLGRVSVEALLEGCPVVARDSGGSHDVLEGGRLGSLYENPAQGAAKLRAVVTDVPLQQLESAREAALSTYGKEAFAQKVLSFYAHIVPSGK